MGFWSDFWKRVTGGAKPPVKPPIPPQPPVHGSRLVSLGVFPPNALCVLQPVGEPPKPAITATGHQHQTFLVPADVPEWGGTLTVSHPGYVTASRWLAIPATDTELDPVLLQPAIPALERLHLQGRHGFRTPAGTHVPLTSVTGFKLVHLVATGQQDAARAFLEAIKPARCVRVLVMAKHLFELTPAAGVGALVETLKLAEECGVYLSVVALADTKSYSFDYEAHVAAVGRACSASKACAFLEIGNELAPLHSTQDASLVDVAYLKRLRSLIPASVAVSLGSTHNGEDESDLFKDGDLLTIHGSRDDGDNGWRWVRHTNEQRALGDRLNKHPVNDEPKRNDLAPDRHLGIAILCRMFRISDTAHFGFGLQCLAPTGAELVAFQARARGWAAIPDDWWGEYKNAGFVNSPVKSFDGAVRIYSSVNGNQAYSLVLGAESGLRIHWSDEWPLRDLVLVDDGCRLYKVSR